MTGTRQLTVTVRRDLLDRLAGVARSNADLNATCPIAEAVRTAVPGIARVNASQFLIFLTLGPGFTFDDGSIRIQTLGVPTPPEIDRYLTAWDTAPPKVRRSFAEISFTLQLPDGFRLVQR